MKLRTPYMVVPLAVLESSHGNDLGNPSDFQGPHLGNRGEGEMAYGRKSYTTRARSRTYARRAPARRGVRRSGRTSGRRSSSPGTLRIVIEGGGVNPVARPQMGVTTQAIGRRKF